jgi:two-component system, NarL family, sensor kinase
MNQSSWMLGPIVGLFIGIFALELATDPDYVIGYLYIIPIVLANFNFNPRLAFQLNFQLTVVAVLLISIDIWQEYPIQTPMVINRSIAIVSLIFTAIITRILSDRQRLIQRTLTTQQLQLQAQDKLMNIREDFASTLAHDLKTPLLGAIETLIALDQEQFGSIHPQQKTIINTILRSHQGSLKLVETLLDIYRNETEGLVLKLAPVELVNLVEDVTAALLNLTTSRRVYVSINYGESDFQSFPQRYKS